MLWMYSAIAFDVFVGHRERRHPSFGTAAVDDRHDQLAVLIAEHQLRAEQVGTVQLSPPRRSSPWHSAQVTPNSALPRAIDRRIAGRTLLRRKHSGPASAALAAAAVAGRRLRRRRLAASAGGGACATSVETTSAAAAAAVDTLHHQTLLQASLKTE